MHSPTTALRSGMLDVPGASLYYEVRGSGPALLLIATGNGDAAPFEPLADQLADRYTVISYDRRGFSRSPLTAPVDDDQRLAVETDDASHLLDHLGVSSAHVMGTCSGAIIALAMMERHPDKVKTMVVHEPPLVSVLPDAAHWLQFHEDLYATYRDDSIEAARDIFREYAGLAGDTRPPAGMELPPDRLADLLARLKINQVFWFEHELRTYPAFRPDITALKSVSDRLVFAGGNMTREHFSCLPNTVLAEKVGNEIAEFPGGHVGHVTHPIEYADTLDGVLNARNT